MKITPQGKIIARGKDGIPWELYENGYLLFKPTKEQNTLANPSPAPSWKEKYGDNIIAIGFTNKVYAPEDSSYLFSKYNKYIDRKLTKLQYVETHQVNTSNVKDMSAMFAESSIKSLDLSSWNTSNVTNMAAMFYGTHALQDLNISKWDTSNVSNMSEMFSYANSLIKLNINNWNTSNVTNMSAMFNKASRLKYLNIGKWDTSNVSNIYQMFNMASGLQDLNIENWNMSKVIFFDEFLTGNDNLQLLDCSKMTSTHNNIKEFFTTNIGLGNIDLPDDCVVLLPN